MNDTNTGAQRPEDVTIERWQYDNPSWLVIVVHPVIWSPPGGEVVEEIEIKVEHRETGEILRSTGRDAGMAFAMIDHLISERL